VHRTRRVRGSSPIPATCVLLVGLAALPLGGCGGASGAPGGGGYDGLTTDARITEDNAAPLAAVALGLGTGLDAFVGRPLVGTAKPADGVAVLPLPFTPDAVLRKDLRVAPAEENGDVVAFDYLVPGPAGGQVRVYGNLWPDGTGVLATTFTDYGRGDGSELGGTVTYLIVARDADTGRITDMDIRLAGFVLAEAASDLRLDGEIAATSPVPGRVENRLDVEGRDRVTGKAFRYRDFLLVRATPAVGTPAEDLEGEAFEGAAGRLTVTTDAPVAWVGASPVGGGPVRLAGAEATAARVTPLSDGTAEIAVDADGDGTFETVHVVGWDAVK